MWEPTDGHAQLCASQMHMHQSQQDSCSEASSQQAAPRSCPCKPAHSAPSETLLPFIAEPEVASGRGVTSPCQGGDTSCCDPPQPGRGWDQSPHVTPVGASSHIPALLSALWKSGFDAVQAGEAAAAASVLLLRLSWWKSIRLNFNSFSVLMLVPSKGHSYLSINSALCCKIGIQRAVWNFFHPLLLLCLCRARSQLSFYPQIPS